MIKEFKSIPKEYISLVINDVLDSIVLYQNRNRGKYNISSNFLYHKGIFDITLSFKRYCEEIYGLNNDESFIVWKYIRNKYNRMSYKKDMINRGVYRINCADDLKNEFLSKAWERGYQMWLEDKENREKIKKSKNLNVCIG